MIVSDDTSHITSEVDPPLLEPLLASRTCLNNNTIQENSPPEATITLHGESLDLHHLFPDGVFFTDSKNTINENDSKIDVQDENLPSSSIPSSVNPNASPKYLRNNNTFGWMKINSFLPKLIGQSRYHRSQSIMNPFFISRNKSNSTTGLTPVVNSLSIDHESKNSMNAPWYKKKKNKNKTRITKHSSISFAQSTPLFLKILVPLLLIVNHVIFYLAQTKPMWNLAYKTDVTITATANTLKSKAAADALNIPHNYEYKSQESKIVETFTYMDAIRKLWEGVGLGDAQTLSKVAAALLVIFSGIWPHLKLFLLHVGWFAPFAHGLWIQEKKCGQAGDDDDEDMKTKLCCCCSSSSSTDNNHRDVTRHGTKSACGFCCATIHKHTTHTFRSQYLRLLSTLGKWSLADVLVVCILIAVLHLDWDVHPDEIREGIKRELPTLLEYAHSKYPNEVQDCTDLLKYTCGKHALVIHYPACLACEALIKNAFYHPEWTASEGKDILDGILLEGGGYAQLRVMGMVGTYYFCGAVLMSILLSLIIEFFDEKDRVCVEEEMLDQRRESESESELELRVDSVTTSQHLANEDILSPQQQSCQNNKESTSFYAGLDRRNAHSTPHTFIIPPPTTNFPRLKQTLFVLLSLSSFPFVLYAVALPTTQRLVYGGGPTLLYEVLGMIWEKEYSLTSLVKTTGEAGGWDTFLMLTFALFAVIGPILRSICLILHVLLQLPAALIADCLEKPRERTAVRMALYRITCAVRRTLLLAIDALGAICCWEVLLVALAMIQLEMPSITDTIYQDDRCQEVDASHGKTCIEVQFNALDSMLMIVVAWIILVTSSQLAIDLAGDEDDQPYFMKQNETRYEFGQPIPRHRSNLSRDRAWSGYEVGNINEISDAVRSKDLRDNKIILPPSEEQCDNGLEQIEFV